jgi:hypothetical protein
VVVEVVATSAAVLMADLVDLVVEEDIILDLGDLEL